MEFEQAQAIESNENKELTPIVLTKEEYDTLFDLEIPNEEKQKIMDQKGISFDSGEIVIEVDGVKQMVTTRNDDFFTALSPEMIEDKHGKEMRNMIEQG